MAHIDGDVTQMPLFDHPIVYRSRDSGSDPLRQGDALLADPRERSTHGEGPAAFDCNEGTAQFLDLAFVFLSWDFTVLVVEDQLALPGLTADTPLRYMAKIR